MLASCVPWALRRWMGSLLGFPNSLSIIPHDCESNKIFDCCLKILGRASLGVIPMPSCSSPSGGRPCATSRMPGSTRLDSKPWIPGGVNVLMADGSARSIKNSISPLTWMQLGTRANGDVVSADSY